MTPEAKKILDAMEIGVWLSTRSICLAAGMIYPGDKSADHNQAYAPLKELMAMGLVKKLRWPEREHYTQYLKLMDGMS